MRGPWKSPAKGFTWLWSAPGAAGLEPPLLNPERPWIRDRWNWQQHEQHRDDRSEAFCVVLREGTHVWEFEVKATCAGTFRVPPARAEEMYHPECYGHSSSEEFLIE